MRVTRSIGIQSTRPTISQLMHPGLDKDHATSSPEAVNDDGAVLRPVVCREFTNAISVAFVSSICCFAGFTMERKLSPRTLKATKKKQEAKEEDGKNKQMPSQPSRFVPL